MSSSEPDRAWRRRVEEVADLVVWIATARPATLGEGRLVCVDGRAGAGKSTLGAAVVARAARERSARLLHVDDLLAGWSGLPTVGHTLHECVLGPLRRGLPGEYRRYDWLRQELAEWCAVEPVDLLCVEGAGAWSAAYRDAVTTLVWVESPEELRLARAGAREEAPEGAPEGAWAPPWWADWRHDEDVLLARERTPDHADVVVESDADGVRVVLA